MVEHEGGGVLPGRRRRGRRCRAALLSVVSRGRRHRGGYRGSLDEPRENLDPHRERFLGDDLRVSSHAIQYDQIDLPLVVLLGRRNARVLWWRRWRRWRRRSPRERAPLRVVWRPCVGVGSRRGALQGLASAFSWRGRRRADGEGGAGGSRSNERSRRGAGRMGRWFVEDDGRNSGWGRDPAMEDGGLQPAGLAVRRRPLNVHPPVVE